jgi:hypothetical protein
MQLNRAVCELKMGIGLALHRLQMETPTSTDHIDDSAIDDRRKSVSTRRSSPRTKRLKGANIVWPLGAPVSCIVRNLSETGAKIEVHTPVPDVFDLVFDVNKSRRSCRVMWRREIQIGVRFI